MTAIQFRELFISTVRATDHIDHEKARMLAASCGWQTFYTDPEHREGYTKLVAPETDGRFLPVEELSYYGGPHPIPEVEPYSGSGPEIPASCGVCGRNPIRVNELFDSAKYPEFKAKVIALKTKAASDAKNAQKIIEEQHEIVKAANFNYDRYERLLAVIDATPVEIPF